MAQRARFASLAVVVVNYGSSDLLRGGLIAVSATLPGATVMVVDNWTTEAERETVRKLCDQNGWSLEEPAENLGFGTGCNRGVAAAQELGATQFLLLNPDATIDAGSVTRLVEVSTAQPLTLAAPRILRPDGSLWTNGNRLDLRTGRMLGQDVMARHDVVDWLSGACLMISDQLWRETGGFDDSYFLYWEDVDFSARVIKMGGRLEVVEGATAVHDVGGTQHGNGRAKSTYYYYYNVRNRLLFAQRHLDADGVRRWRRSGTSAAYEIVMRGGRRQFLNPVAPTRAAVRGLRDGLLGRWGRARVWIDEP